MPDARGLPEAVLVATRSEGKLRELVPWFAAVGMRVMTLDDAGLPPTDDEDDLEVFKTFALNALAKARWFFDRSGGRVVVADDSGLVVDSLGGAPGVHSKRWSGRDDLTGVALDAANNAYLLLQLEAAETARPTAGEGGRAAKYVCAAAGVWRDGEVVVMGETHGRIARQRRGAHGFGYDPYFVSDDLAMTFAEAAPSEKSRVSHRGRAFRALVDEMRRRGVFSASGRPAHGVEGQDSGGGS